MIASVIKYSRELFVLHRGYFVAYGVVLAFALWHCSAYAQQTSLLWVNGRYSAFWDGFFYWYTYLGDGKLYVGVIVLMALVRQWRPWAMVGLGAFVLSSVVTQCVKRLLDCPRPPAVIAADLLHLPPGKIEMFHSFPSGHACVGFSLSCLCVFRFGCRRWWVTAGCLLAACLVAYSRMYLAKHFLIDVSVGSFIGVVFTVFFMAVYGGTPSRRQQFFCSFSQSQ